MKSMSIYLSFNGCCEEAFNLYRKVFGGKFSMVERFKEAKGFEALKPEDMEKILHMGLALPNGTELMGSDLPSSRPKAMFGDNFSICVMTESRDESDRIFALLSEGGAVTMPLQETFWGSYFGLAKDRFGINWMIDFYNPK
jgi:PhnB protein